MRLARNIALGGVCLAIHFGAQAQGRPGGAGEHRQHGEAPTAQSGMAAPEQRRGPGREWTQAPVIVPVMRDGVRDRATAVLRAQNIEAAVLDVFAPDATAPEARRQLPLAPEGTKVGMLPKLGNFYWVSARSEADGRVVVASTTTYFSEPGPAPTRLLLERKNELELIPQPLPREHSNYRESEKWKFLVRLDGQPLANRAVKMETEFGSKTTFHSDAEGIVTVLFPRDIKPQEPGREGQQHTMGPRRAKFVLSAEAESAGKRYLTAFNSTYSPDPDRNRSLAWGAAFGVLGMVAATPLLRRRNAQSAQGENHA